MVLQPNSGAPIIGNIVEPGIADHRRHAWYRDRIGQTVEEGFAGRSLCGLVLIFADREITRRMYQYVDVLRKPVDQLEALRK